MANPAIEERHSPVEPAGEGRSLWRQTLEAGASLLQDMTPLKDFDIESDLARIQVPTMLFCGEFDEVTPPTVERAHRAIQGSEFVVLPGCSHMAQAEDLDAVLGLLRGWLDRVERRGGDEA